MARYFSGSFAPKTFSKSGLPSANTMTGIAVFVSDTNELAWSDGTIWKFLKNLDVSSQTSAFTIDASINGKFILLNVATPTTLTLPNSAPVGFSFAVMQYGAGQVTLAGAAGANLRTLYGLKSSGQYAVLVATCITNAGGAAAEWWISGDTDI